MVVFKLRKPSTWRRRAPSYTEPGLSLLGFWLKLGGPDFPRFRRTPLSSTHQTTHRTFFYFTGLPWPPTVPLLTQLPVAGVVTAAVVKVAEAAVPSQSVHDPGRTDGVYKRCLPVSWQEQKWGSQSRGYNSESASCAVSLECHHCALVPSSNLFPHLYNVPYPPPRSAPASI